MIKKNKILSTIVLAVLVLVFSGPSAWAAEGGIEPVLRPVADELPGAGGITWSPKVNYSELVLTISRPDGTVFRKAFASGRTPYVGLSNILGDNYADGSYTYELRVIPVSSRKVRQEGELDAASKEKLESHKALIQSGHFMIRGGAIVTSGESEAVTPREPGSGGLKGGVPVSTSSSDDISRTADICYVDDLIVDGSLCVGFDCVCNYSFGFDTIVLKENNLRIFFDDTSASASFPRNDWRILINDSANGGASYFGIEDSTAGRRVFTLEAGAPTHSLYVDDGGRLGLGTSTPVVDAHIVSGNTPTLRLEQDGSSGFTPQTWDVAGNEANFFVRDATNGSQLPFKIRPGADSNSLFVDSDGDIGLGTASPGASLHVKAVSDDPGILVETNSTTNAKVIVEKDSGARGVVGSAGSFTFMGSESDNALRLYVNNTSRLKLNVTTNAKILEMSDGGFYDGVWNDASSRALKESIINLTAEDAMNTLEGLTPVRFYYKTNKEDEHVGFIAEDVPDLVATKERKSLGAMDVVAVLTKVVKEQQKTISELKTKVDKLEKKQ